MIPPVRSILVALGAAGLLLSSHASEELDTLKKSTERWIEVRSRLSKDRSDWENEKQLLRATIDTLTSTRNALKENVEILEMETKSLTEKIQESQDAVETYEATNDIILQAIGGYETRVKELARWLPSPLLDEINPLLRKIPSAADHTVPAPNRLQNVVAIATLIDEFNNDLTLTHTIKTLDNGEVIDVRVLYWGLATAYASNANGDRAWIVKPAADEWQWVAVTDNALAIKQLFEVYDKTIDPVAVEVPYSFARKEAAQ